MKKLVLILAVAVVGLSGCVVHPLGYGHHGGGRHYQQGPVYEQPGPGPRAYRDRDGDGVPNGYDRRPRNPNRY